MLTRLRRFAALGILVGAAATTLPAQPASPPSGSGTRLGFRLDYLTQTVSWDNGTGKSTSGLNSALAAAVLQLGIGRSSTASLIAGYATTELNGLLFRQLPLSVDFEAGGVGGLVLGAELNLGIISERRVSLSAQAQFMAQLGLSKTWSIPGLAVAGSLEGSPTWMRAMVGPLIVFGAEDRVRPYLFPFFQYVWGTFALKESVETLSGTESKDVRGKSLFGVAGGLELPLSPGIRIKAEGGVYPRSGGADYSATIKTMFAF
jgi:hypothetical protein